jgi:hypothetical protein
MATPGTVDLGDLSGLVDAGLKLLREGLAPFVQDALKAAHGAAWWTLGVEGRIRSDRLAWVLEVLGSGSGEGSDAERMAALDVEDLIAVTDFRST